MQDKYVGDIVDFVKYGLLRVLSPGFKLGVAWYLFPDSSKKDDGERLRYLRAPKKWRSRDPELFDKLKEIVQKKQRKVATIEKSALLPKDTRYASERLYFNGKLNKNYEWRKQWFSRVKEELSGCNLVFVDPDNGLYEEERFKYGKREFWKRLPFREALDLAEGRTAILYHYFHRNKKHKSQAQDWLKEFKKLGKDVCVIWWHGRGSVVAQLFFIVNPKPSINAKLQEFVEGWKPNAELVYP